MIAGQFFCWRNTNCYECCHRSTRCLHPFVVQLHVSSLTKPCLAMYVSVNHGGDSEENHQSKVSVLICCGLLLGESSLRPSTVTRRAQCSPHIFKHSNCVRTREPSRQHSIPSKREQPDSQTTCEGLKLSSFAAEPEETSSTPGGLRTLVCTQWCANGLWNVSLPDSQSILRNECLPSNPGGVMGAAK